MNRNTPSALPAATERQLATYTSAALVGLGVLTTAQVADAAILTTTAGGTSISVSSGTSNRALYLFAGQGFASGAGPALTLALTGNQFGSTSYFSNRRNAGVANLNVVGNGNYANNLAINFTVNATAGTFLAAGTTRIGTRSVESGGGGGTPGPTIFNNGNFVGQTGYIGFSFTDPTKSTQTDYGWAQISEGGNQQTLTLINAAYDNTGAAIKTGQTVVPEPGSLALLAGGAGMLAAWRLRAAKRRQAATAPDDTALAS